MKIAVLGLGMTGEAVAHRLQEGGHDLTAWNRNPGRADEFAEPGAAEADRPAEAVATVEVAASSLANDDTVRDFALGTGGVVAALGTRPYHPRLAAVVPGLYQEAAEDGLDDDDIVTVAQLHR